jgi:hypothetical protein
MNPGIAVRAAVIIVAEATSASLPVKRGPAFEPG